MNQQLVRSLFDYKDGGLYWRLYRGGNAKAGCRAGCLLKTGYRSIHVSGSGYQEHRLIFLWWHGVIPDQIDHINRIKDDNRIENLRRSNYSLNQANTNDRPSASGVRGVRFDDEVGKWRARIYCNGKEYNLGYFLSLDDASNAYREKFRELFPSLIE